MSDDAKSAGARAWQGGRVVITKAGKPYMDLLPHVDTPQARKPGRLKGKIRMSADFDSTPEDIIDGFKDGL
jgi:antitoxin (DNA-binding transcriptional repressor) of toxin-antitoxin stability system